MRWRIPVVPLARPALLAAGLAAAVFPPLSPAFGDALPCDVPEELMQVDDKLPHLAERLRAGQPVRIVAIGGASTTGLAAGSSDLAYPRRLQEILAQWYPSSSITVVNRGVPRQTAQQMLERFPTDVIPEDPVMVIWETGTTDAVRGVGVDDFAATVQTGIDELKAHGIDIMLIDMQFSHSTATVIDFERYLSALHRVGDVNDVNVFPRFEMMRYWSEQNMFNFDGVAKDERAGLAARVYECIAGKLADAIRVALR
ncbi:MAG TPA: GDSL-type esterase/lipase family protein [Stellaceae bacterium]|nr:GDSL-type esterase/lipase family protein [Stellaceae bacterium]